MDAMTTDKVDVWVFRAKVALVIIGAAIVVAVGILTYRYFEEKRSLEAFNKLFEAQVIEESAAKLDESSKNEMENSVSGNTYLQMMKKLSDAQQKTYEEILKEVRTKYPGTAAFANASFKLARWYMETDKVAETLPLFEDVIGAFKKDGDQVLFAALAYEGKAVAFEKMGRLDEAISTHTEALNLKGNPLKPLAYLGLARSQVAKGDKTKAKENYKKIVEEFPDSSYSLKAKALSAFL